MATQTKTIEVTRSSSQDAAKLAAETAADHGTRLSGNMRWYGRMGPSYREVRTKDGRAVRVFEPQD